MRMLFKEKTLLCVIALLAALLLAACGEKTADPQEEEENTVPEELTVGMSCDNPPFGWLQQEEDEYTMDIEDGDGYAGGYDVQIAAFLGDELGAEISLRLFDRGDLLEAVEKGEIDLVISGVNPLESRANRVDFSDAYYENNYVVIVQKDGPFADETSVEGFDGAKLTAQNGSYIYDELLPQIKNAEVMPALTFHEDMRVALSNGVIDGYVTTLPEGMSVTRLHPEYAMITFNDGEGFETDDEFSTVAIGVAKDRETLKDAVNAALHKLSVEERRVMMDRAIYAEPEENETDREE